METELLLVCLEGKREEFRDFVHFVAVSCLFVVGSVRLQTRDVPIATALCIRTALGWLVTDCVCGWVGACARVCWCVRLYLDWLRRVQWPVRGRLLWELRTAWHCTSCTKLLVTCTVGPFHQYKQDGTIKIQVSLKYVVNPLQELEPLVWMLTVA